MAYEGSHSPSRLGTIDCLTVSYCAAVTVSLLTVTLRLYHAISMIFPMLVSTSAPEKVERLGENAAHTYQTHWVLKSLNYRSPEMWAGY